VADAVTATNKNDKQFPIHPEGQYTAVCVDGIDLGEQHNEKFGNLSQKYAIVFQTTEINPETGKRFEIAERYTVSMGEKANLRKFLGQWRGKTYSNAEAEEGAPLHKLEGVNALVQIGHNTSEATNKTYANIISIMPLPKGMPRIKAEGYTRAEYWTEVKAKARKPEPAAVGGGEDFEDFPGALEDTEDDLPF
jgi:hypothetical protein